MAQKAALFFSSRTLGIGIKIEIGGVDLSFTDGAIFENVFIHDFRNDTLIFLEIFSLIPGDLEFRTDSFRFISVGLKNGVFNMRKYKGENQTNFDFFLDAFTSKDTTSSGGQFFIQCHSIKLDNMRFLYADLNDTIAPQVHNSQTVSFTDLEIKKIDARIEDLFFTPDTIQAFLKKLSFIEKSGFTLEDITSGFSMNNLSMNFNNLKIKTPFSHIETNLLFRYDSLSYFSDFLNKVKINTSLDHSVLHLGDIAWFTPDLQGITTHVRISGHISGVISNIKGQNMTIEYGRATLLSGNITMTGLPEFSNTFVQFKLKKLITTPADLETIPVYPLHENRNIQLPDFMKKLTTISFKGEFTGFYNDFVAYGDFFSPLGKISSDLSLKKTAGNDHFRFTGNIKTSGFRLGRFLEQEPLIGNLVFDAKVDGGGTSSDDYKITLSGLMSHLELNGYDYRNATISGDLARKKFSGTFSIRDQNMDMDFSGQLDFSQEIPVLDFISTIAKADLVKMHLFNLDSSLVLSTRFDVNLFGIDPDEMTGTMQFHNARFIKNDHLFDIGNGSLSSYKAKNTRSLTLTSGFADAELFGSFKFRDLPNALARLAGTIFPSIKKIRKTKKIHSQNIQFAIKLKNMDPVTGVFIPDLQVNQGATITGFLKDSTGEMVLNGKIPRLLYNGSEQTGWIINANVINHSVDLSATCKKISFSDSIFSDNFNFILYSKNDTVNFETYWGDETGSTSPVPGNQSAISNSGMIKGEAGFADFPRIRIQLEPSHIVIADTIWKINPNNRVLIDTTSVSIQNLSANTSSQFLKIDGIIDTSSQGGLNILLSSFNLGNFKSYFEKAGIDMKGTLYGNLMISHVLNTPSVNTNLIAEQFSYNGDTLGNLSLVISLDKPNSPLAVAAELYRGKLKTLSAHGTFDPENKNNSLQMNVVLDKLKIYPLEQLLDGLFTNIDGVAMGTLRLSGTLKKPVLTGTVKVQRARFTLDFLKTRYSFAEEIIFKENCISFDSLTVFDMKGNKAMVNGNVYHNYFKDFNYDFTVDANNIHCLNTLKENNELFYGQAYATGNSRIKGDMQNVYLDISGKTEKGTQVFIPLTGTSEISESGYISFKKPEVTDSIPLIRKDSSAQRFSMDLSGIQLNFNLEATPDAEVQIIFDEKIGDIIKGRGNANLKMYINSQGDFNMFGDYFIERGDYLFTLKNVINKRFEVEKGGVIKWNGDPYDAEVNMSAKYPLRASLGDLNPGSDSIDKGRVPVDCRLLITGKLMNPTIRFDLDLPGADESNLNKISPVRENEQEMNKQIFSLLVLGRFQSLYSSSGEGNILGGASAAYSNSAEFLSNQLSNWLSQISDDFDVGVKYRPGENISGSDLEVALSTQLFNDRLTINGNVGTTGNQSASGNVGTTSSQSASSIVGDVMVEYLLTKDGKLRVKAFHDSNDYTTLTGQSPYKQGVGLSYRKEFNKFSDLFKKKNKSVIGNQ